MSDDYYCWLIELIGDGCTELCYQKLLWKLYSTDFVYELDYDSNRAVDGLELRKKYYKKCGYGLNEVLLNKKPCSVLEMLIALSYRTERELIYDPCPGNDARFWFWQILSNLNLAVYDDYYYFEGRINEILDIFMHHKYDADGTHGSAFPCPGVYQDLRKMDLWWQLGMYFQKNCSLQIL